MKVLFMTVLTLTAVAAAGCSGQFWGGAAGGAVGGAAGYEYNFHRNLQKIEEDYKAGRISKEEYEIRKDQIQKDSLLK